MARQARKRCEIGTYHVMLSMEGPAICISI